MEYLLGLKIVLRADQYQLVDVLVLLLMMIQVLLIMVHVKYVIHDLVMMVESL